MKPTISSTIWIKEGDKYTGTMSNHGDICTCGEVLQKNYTDANKVKALIQLGAMSSVGEKLEDCLVYPQETKLVFAECDLDTMKAVANKYSKSYIYVFDSETSVWWFGPDKNVELEFILKRASKNGKDSNNID